MPVINSRGFTGYGGGVLRPGTGGFIPRSQRWVTFHVDVDVGNLMTLGTRMEAVLHAALVRNLGEAAGEIITRARAKLQDKPDDVTTPDGNIYGYDTGDMYNALTAVLVDAAGANLHGVFYDLEAPATPYWVFVEFGHMTRGGNWWPGYHFLSGTVAESEGMIRQKVREAWHDAAIVLASQARVGGSLGLGRVKGYPSGSVHAGLKA